MHLLESLGLHVAHALEEVAGGTDADDFVIDNDGVFAGELLTMFVQTAAQRAARAGGVVGVAVVRLADGEDAHAAARAAYAAGTGPGLTVVRRSDDEIALVEVGHDGDAHDRLAEALAACRDAVTVRSIGTAWIRLTAGSHESVDSDLSARLVGFAAESHDHFAPPHSPSELGAHAA
jgi:hypothetical protein